MLTPPERFIRRMATPIVFFSGNRADYSLLVPLAQAVHTDSELELHWWLGADHTADGTLAQVQADGWPSLLPFPTLSGELTDPIQRSAVHTKAAVTWLQALRPKALVVLGDRIEMAAVALVAFNAGIPIVQLAAGDVSQGGCQDDRLRFVVSDLAAVCACFSYESYQRQQARAFVDQQVVQVSSPVVETLASVPAKPTAVLCEAFAWPVAAKVALVTQHPVPNHDNMADLTSLFEALEAQTKLHALWTAPNQDTVDGVALWQAIQRRCAANSLWRAVHTLGRARYVGWLRACDVVVGNTSSGLYETPYVGKPSVCLGPRQQGRQRGANVITVEQVSVGTLSQALEQALNNEPFRRACQQAVPPFGEAPSSQQMVALIKALVAGEPAGTPAQ